MVYSVAYAEGIDKDLAKLYEIETRDLNKAVTRNLDRFPSDFMFQLTKEEFKSLMFQFGTSNRGGTRKSPRVFTEQGESAFMCGKPTIFL